MLIKKGNLPSSHLLCDFQLFMKGECVVVTRKYSAKTDETVEQENIPRKPKRESKFSCCCHVYMDFVRSYHGEFL